MDDIERIGAQIRGAVLAQRRAEYAAAPPAIDWISIDDKNCPPPEWTWVLVAYPARWEYGPRCAQETAMYFDGKWHDTVGLKPIERDGFIKVTHWRRLPPPPQGMEGDIDERERAENVRLRGAWMTQMSREYDRMRAMGIDRLTGGPLP